MGQSFSAQVLRVKLKMGVERCSMQQSKKTNAQKIARREIATMLSQNKDESARIRTEGLLYQENLLVVLELVSVMFSFLSQRMQLLLAAKPPCPEDFDETCSTIIYCAARIAEVPELREVAQQLALKFGTEWAEAHRNNHSGKVPPRIVTLLAATPPPLARIVPVLRQIAADHDVEWEPKWHWEEEQRDNPQALGAVARLRAGDAPEAPNTDAAAAVAAAADDAAQGHNLGEEEEDGVVPAAKAVAPVAAVPAAAPVAPPRPSAAALAPPSYDAALEDTLNQHNAAVAQQSGGAGYDYTLPPADKPGMQGGTGASAGANGGVRNSAVQKAAMSPSPTAPAPAPAQSQFQPQQGAAAAPAPSQSPAGMTLEERLKRLNP